MTINDRLMLERRKRNLNQTEAARLAGVSQGHISNIERGVTHDYKTTKTLLEAWGLDFEQLMLEELGITSKVEQEIDKDLSLRPEDRTLLVQFYRLMRARGPMGPGDPAN